MSGATSRRKGQKAEQAVARMLRAWGWAARTSRSVQGVQGGADLITDCPLSIEVKDHQRIELSAWLDQAVRQAEPGRPGVVFAKRRGRANAAEWYAVMRVADLLELVRRIP